MLSVLGCASGSGVDEKPAARTGGQSGPAVPAGAFRAVVERVVDGDTLLARRDGRRVRVRLIGIDAPESVMPDAAVECFGPQAAAGLRNLLPRGTVIRASVQDRRSAEHRDRFGRDLWDVWLADGAFLQAEVVRAGLARARPYPPDTKYADVLAAAEDAASAAGAGLHRACP